MTSVRSMAIADPDAMHELGVQLGRVLTRGDLVILTGPLGAGKTTLTRGIGEGLGVRGPVQSPTFVIARTHPSLVAGAPLVHVDAYRLADASEVGTTSSRHMPRSDQIRAAPLSRAAARNPR